VTSRWQRSRDSNDPGNAIKFTTYRLRPSGSPGDPDIFGAQQYAPLLDIDVPAWQPATKGGGCAPPVVVLPAVIVVAR